MSSPTVRERIKAIATQMFGVKPHPATLREFEVALAGLLQPIGDEVTQAELAFRKAILAADATTAAGKKQLAQAGPEYARFLEAKATQETCVQMLRTCRSNVRSLTEEMRLERG